MVNPLGIRKEYTYDLAGRLVKFKNGRGQEITYQYDVSNNLVKKTLPDGGDLDYAYDVDNQVTQVTDADSILKYEYATYTGLGPYFGTAGQQLKGAKIRETYGAKGDPRYAVQASGFAIFGQSAMFTDANGNRTWAIELPGHVHLRTDLDLIPGEPASNWDSDYGYDVGHRMIKTDLSSMGPLQFTYDRVGRRSSMYFEWGYAANHATYDYDAAGQLLRLTEKNRDGSIVADFAYSYDAAGNRDEMTDRQGTHTFGYDDRYQLINATHPVNPAETFAYDGVGNRTSSHISPSYTYNTANQLLEDAEFTYSYDLDGNCLGKLNKLNGERHEYIFNSENRMTGYRKYDIQGALVTTADYFYDPVGRRISKRVGGALTRYLYVEEDIWISVAPNGQFTRYVHGPGIDEPLMEDVTTCGSIGCSQQYKVYYADALGRIREARGYPPWAESYQYDSFGQILSATTPSPLRPGGPAYSFTGREYDAESGLGYFRARYYDPHTGRFTAEDPIGFEAHTNFYTYVSNRPILLTDPSGMAPPGRKSPSDIPQGKGLALGEAWTNICSDMGKEWSLVYWDKFEGDPFKDHVKYAGWEYAFGKECKALKVAGREYTHWCKRIRPPAPVTAGWCNCCYRCKK